jgi:hypothetical protein
MHGQCDSVIHAYFSHQPAYMRLHSALVDTQRIRNLPIWLASPEQAQHLALARCESGAV